ncbi:MAG: hypothetical protein ABR920_14510, partial [Terriglobales bacterium]
PMQKDFLVSRSQKSDSFLIVVQGREVVRQLQVEPISVLGQLCCLRWRFRACLSVSRSAASSGV